MKEERLKILETCLGAIQDAHDVLEEVRDEEEQAYDNLPEGLQCSERGDLMQEAMDNLDEVVSSLDEVISNLEDIVSAAYNPDVMEIDPWRKLEVGDIVTHKTFGSGIITSIEGKYYYVNFKERTLKFIFPDAIDKGYITL